MTVDGAGTTWNCFDYLSVGHIGKGMLTISNGGTINVASSTFVSYFPGSTGKIQFGPGGGHLSTQSLCASESQLAGTGTVDAFGIVSDIDLVFDSDASKVRTIHFNSRPSQDITVDLDVSDPNNTGYLGAGFLGTGSLTVENGVSIKSRSVALGYHYGSTGTAHITGHGSTWETGWLKVGVYGNGSLLIDNGGLVRSWSCYVGNSHNARGSIKVSGTGSRFDDYGYGELFLGSEGARGILEIDKGAEVACAVCILGSGGERGSYGEMLVRDTRSKFTGSQLSIHNGLLSITDGGIVEDAWCDICGYSQGTATAEVIGAGSTWKNEGNLYVGNRKTTGRGNGFLVIGNGGLARVGGTLAIDLDVDDGSYIKMHGGGMLALAGDADNSLVNFLNLIAGTDDIRYWDDSISDWADITGATYGEDYSLSHVTEGDLAGYTVLTVMTAVPEPSTFVGLLGLCLAGRLVLSRRKR